MENTILLNIIKLYNFIIAFAIFLIIVVFVLRFMLKKFDLTPRKIKLYGLFFELDDLSILALSISTLRYIFILWCIVSSSSASVIWLVVLIILSIIFNLLPFNPFGLAFDLVNSIVQYFSFVGCGLLLGYINEVRFEWYVAVITVLLAIFIFTYSTYFYLKNVNDIASRNKYTRRKISERGIKKS